MLIGIVSGVIAGVIAGVVWDKRLLYRIILACTLGGIFLLLIEIGNIESHVITAVFVSFMIGFAVSRVTLHVRKSRQRRPQEDSK